MAADRNFKRDGPSIAEYRCPINADYVNLPVTAGRARGGFKLGISGSGGFKAISGVVETHVSACVMTPMFRTSPSGG